MTHQPTGDTRVLCTWTSCTPGAASLARTALHRTLVRMGLSPEVISDAVLAASELAANATEHATGPYEMTLRRTEAEFICEVHDHEPHIPKIPSIPAAAPFSPDPQDRGGGLDALYALLTERGRGLHIVHQLTGGAWGYRLPGGGKKIAWMAIPLPAPATVL